jgi:mono/diheme cytochrome c family protein
MAVETTRTTQAPETPAVTTPRFDPRKAWHEDPPTPPEAEFRRRAARFKLIVLVILLILGAILFWLFVPEKPVDYTDIREHFKYGSIGSEAGKGMPYRIWKALPAMFAQYLPNEGKAGYASLGFVYEADPATGQPRDTPIGFSMRRMQGIEFVGLNCAVCHTGTYRGSSGDPPEKATIELGMPAHQLDLLAYFKFLFDCASDGRFTVENVMAAMDAQQKLGPVDRLIYSIAIPRVRQETLRLKSLAQFMIDHPSGRGRIDTFTPYKTMNFGYRDTADFSVGNADFPSIWNQRIRDGMPLHWDGNNPSLFERNISAAMGAGATPVSLDVPRMNRVADWLLDLKPPAYPSAWKRDAAQAGRGEALYRQHCADCHGLREEQFKGRQVGALEPIARIKTDPERLDSYTLDLAYNQYTLGAGRSWRFHNFRKTDGYANQPIDGIWARAPYLHNGSVPTLRDLLNPPCSVKELGQLGYPSPPEGWEQLGSQEREAWAVRAAGGLSDDAVKAIIAKSRALGRRPPVFFRGYDVYDQDRAGFVADVGSEGGRPFTRFDVNIRGNGNGGHDFGLDLPAADKDALVEYLKGL